MISKGSFCFHSENYYLENNGNKIISTDFFPTNYFCVKVYNISAHYKNIFLFLVME